jgi:hypothetical protein
MTQKVFNGSLRRIRRRMKLAKKKMEAATVRQRKMMEWIFCALTAASGQCCGESQG